MNSATLKQLRKVVDVIADKDPSEDYLQWMLGGPLSDLLDANRYDFNRDAHRKALGLKPLNPPLLNFISTIMLPARTTRFVPREKYVVNMEPGKHVKLAYVDPVFMEGADEEIEEPTEGIELRRYVLARPSVFTPVMEEIRKEGFATKTTRSELFSMLEKQPDGPKSNAGPLLTNGYANLFEMVLKGIPRLVGVRWGGCRGGWGVSAREVSGPRRWDVGDQFFSRNSRLPSAA